MGSALRRCDGHRTEEGRETLGVEGRARGGVAAPGTAPNLRRWSAPARHAAAARHRSAGRPHRHWGRNTPAATRGNGRERQRVATGRRRRGGVEYSTKLDTMVGRGTPRRGVHSASDRRTHQHKEVHKPGNTQPGPARGCTRPRVREQSGGGGGGVGHSTKLERVGCRGTPRQCVHCASGGCTDRGGAATQPRCGRTADRADAPTRVAASRRWGGGVQHTTEVDAVVPRDVVRRRIDSAT